ncbi:hypothetical protein S40285_04366 [Stachybotrys chlorohalonatus IBT 40285]|uniref:L-ornithine N(5)-monooxygenase [NAD(P)H] n=1 Tax=Stachybotrys chlorohalonatus (strain IBT 40285) TaxID=1283841 RepID=A0A084QG43_STAC4|nr:hypothetical protein S40285_04366 [Stachybotrys chlorohalonata IBT 40285]
MSPHSEVVLNGSDDGDASPVRINGSSFNDHSSSAASYTSHSTSSTPLTTHTTNGHQRALSPNSHQPSLSPYLPAVADDEDPNTEYDLVCVGFGPASLGIAVAMHDALAAGRSLRPDGASPKVLFVEKQSRFAWHSGMLLPGAKMQISFIKDMATLRDPRSQFTFMNYLHSNGRLVEFTNLDTFLPAREEYEDYLRWCASHFGHVVRYSSEVLSVTPDGESSATGSPLKGSPVRTFTVRASNAKTGRISSYRGRQVLIATGGQPSLPKSFPVKHPRVIHSSQFGHKIPELLPNKSSPYRVAVVGAGQSAAEIFHTIQQQYPNSKTYLIMRPEYLKPSDDSPFVSVNTIFNPDFVDNVFPRPPKSRYNFLQDARATNYSVVRLNLIETLYEVMYDQLRTLGRDESLWPHRILAGRQISSIDPSGDGSLEVKVEVAAEDSKEGFVDVPTETLDVDVVIAATGYTRRGHVDILRDAWSMLPEAGASSADDLGKGITGWNVSTEQGERKISVGRDYKVKFIPGTVSNGSGVWLQGLCEGTHGLSDSLLSIIATRSGEMVDSLFGQRKC